MGLNFFVSFSIHDKKFAIAAKNVVTIVKEGKISLTGESNLVYGEIKVNNKSVPMVNLSKELKLPFSIPLKDAVILIVEDSNLRQAGVIVDKIEELSLIENSSILESTFKNKYISGQTEINNNIVHILDPNKTIALSK